MKKGKKVYEAEKKICGFGLVVVMSSCLACFIRLVELAWSVHEYLSAGPSCQ